MPVYAATNPLQTDPELRKIYAAFIRYAATDGQKPGADLGQLPEGYAPIPTGWVAQALVSASAIEKGVGATTETDAGFGDSSSGGDFYGDGGSSDSGSGGDPQATGDVAGDLVGDPTPDDPELAPTTMAIPLGFLAGLAAAVAVPLFPRIRRLF
jgi:hypothetical protein